MIFFMRAWILLLVLLACSSPPPPDLFRSETMSSDALIVPLNGTEELRAGLKEELKSFDSTGIGRRPVYEKYVDNLGVNGILSVLHDIRSGCHDEAHDLGRIAFAKLGSVGAALRACDGGCNSGCMHGVLMEAFSAVPPHEHPEGTEAHEHHVEIEDISAALPSFCFDERIADLYPPGDCAHGIGHALMFMTGYNINKSLDACAGFKNKTMEFYCATGEYMEYVNKYHQKDENVSLFYPCDTHRFPAACFRYKISYVMEKVSQVSGIYDGMDIIAAQCGNLTGFARLGCYHGIGNANLNTVYYKVLTPAQVCKYGNADDQEICIEGLVERFAKYDLEKGIKLCEDYEGHNKEVCLAAAVGDMYRSNKSFRLYYDE